MRECNVHFQTKYKKGNNDLNRIETLISCNFDGKYFNKNNINDEGVRINTFLNEILINKKEVIIPQGYISL